MTAYDVIVVGVGGMGAAAAYHLARRGRRVLGLERFDVPNRMGSSHGLTRIIRLAYYESPAYVPLLHRAFHNWRETERAYGEQLLFTTGSLDAGPAQDRVFTGSLASCLEHGIGHEVLDAAEVNRRYPAYCLPPGHMALLQADGGFVASERAIVAHTTLAQAHGADIRARERVLGWEPRNDGVRVTTDRGTYDAGRLVLSAGAWMDQFVPALRGVSVPERQVLGWFQPSDPAPFRPSAFPVFNLLVDEGRYYGLPVWGMPGFKIGRYHHLGEIGPAETTDRDVHPADEAVLRDCVARYFPAANGPVMGLTACLFTNTPDEHFIIDTLPGLPQVCVASPCSGHGYKFCSVIGEVLADMVDGRASGLDVSLFRLEREMAAAA